MKATQLSGASPVPLYLDSTGGSMLTKVLSVVGFGWKEASTPPSVQVHCLSESKKLVLQSILVSNRGVTSQIIQSQT